MLRILLVGHGRMGRLVESLASEYGCDVAAAVDVDSASALSSDHWSWGSIDVAIAFSFPEAVPLNVPAIARHGVNIVIGTSGWSAHERDVRTAVEQAGVGVVAAPNFSPGVVLFEAVAAKAAALFAGQRDVGAWVHEAH